MSDVRPVKRLVAPEVLQSPSVDALIADAMSIIEMELLKFKAKVRRGLSLEAEEGRLLNGYIKSLVELSKEDRALQVGTDFSKLSSEEIADLLKLTPRQIKGTSENP